MSALDSKLYDLRRARNKLNPGGGHTGEVNSRVYKLRDAYAELIKNDNADPGALLDALWVAIENHPDFGSAVYHLDLAIQNTEYEIEQERLAREREARAKAEAEQAAKLRESQQSQFSPKSGKTKK